MTAFAVLAAVAGSLIAGGLVCAVAAFPRVDPSRPEDVRPPSRLAELLSAPWAPHRRRRVAIAAVAGLAVLATTGWPVAAIATTAGILSSRLLLSQRPAQQRIARLEALEQWTRRLADVLGASRGLEDALMASARKAPAPIETEVRDLARRLRARMPTDLAVRRWADELADPTADRIAAALLLAATRRGPGVRPVLNQLANQVSRDVSARREIEASRAQHRTTLRWVMIFLAGYTVIIALRPSYSAPFGTLPGQVAMFVVVLLYAAGLAWIHQLARGEKLPRLLAPLPAGGVARAVVREQQ